MMDLGEIIKPGLALFIITVFCALCLGFVYTVTKEPIEKAAAAEKSRAMAQLVPGASAFKNETLLPEGGAQVDGALITEVLTAYNNSGGIEGYVFSVQSGGYGGSVGILAAIAPDGAVSGISIISHNETPGLGAEAVKTEFVNQFDGKSGTLRVMEIPENEYDIEAITSATITTQSVTRSVNAALAFFNEMGA